MLRPYGASSKSPARRWRYENLSVATTTATNHRHQRSDTMSASKKTIGYAVQVAGIGAFAVGAILSLHHAAIAAAFAGGAAAFYVGEKIRTLA
jgi:hypothetical protein